MSEITRYVLCDEQDRIIRGVPVRSNLVFDKRHVSELRRERIRLNMDGSDKTLHIRALDGAGNIVDAKLPNDGPKVNDLIRDLALVVRPHADLSDPQKRVHLYSFVTGVDAMLALFYHKNIKFPRFFSNFESDIRTQDLVKLEDFFVTQRDRRSKSLFGHCYEEDTTMFTIVSGVYLRFLYDSEEKKFIKV